MFNFIADQVEQKNFCTEKNATRGLKEANNDDDGGLGFTGNCIADHLRNPRLKGKWGNRKDKNEK